MPRKTQFADTQRTTDAGAALEGTPFEAIPVRDIEVPDLTTGIVIAIPRDQRPSGSGVDIVNARTRRGRLLRRPGTTQYGDIANNTPVLDIIPVRLEADKDWLIRIDPFLPWGMVSYPTWVPFTASGGGSLPWPLPRARRYDSTQFGAWLYLAMTDFKLVKFITEQQEYMLIEASPVAKFVVSWADRVIAANIKDPVEGLVGTMIAWSSTINPDIWDDESAGVAVLDSAPSDMGDEITGLHVIGNNLIILRERSVWVARKTGIASAPFRFDPLITKLGCDLPYSSQTGKDFVIWADIRTENIYLLGPDLTVRSVSTNIGSAWLADMADPGSVDSLIDFFEDEYHLGIATEVDPINQAEELSPITQTWIFSLGSGSWVKDDSPEVTCFGDGVSIGDSPVIDVLTGVIDAQVPVPADPLKPNPSGWIDDWAFDGVTPTGIFKGVLTGEVLQQSLRFPNDYDGDQFELLVESQNVGSFTNRRTLKTVLLTVFAPLGGKLVLEFANGRQQWIKQKTANMLAFGSVRTQQVGAPFTQITGNEVRFRFRSKSPVWISELWVRMLDKTRQRQVKT